MGGRAIHELKTVAALTPAHEAQLLNYLLLTGSTRGKLVDFRSASVESRFVNTRLDHMERQRFEVDARRGQGDATFCDLVVAVVEDWGTSLELPIYVQAITELLGGEGQVVRQVPMSRGEVAIGTQRFHLAAPEIAFRFTAFNDLSGLPQEAHPLRLLEQSPVRTLYWVNIGRHLVTFTTIGRKMRTGE